MTRSVAPTIALVEPLSPGVVSGGYLYNQRMAERQGSIVRYAVGAEGVPSQVHEPPLAEGGLVLLDSLFLDGRSVQVWRQFARERNGHLGVLVHAFPSFVARAQNREALAAEWPLLPTPQEVELLQSLDLVVAPGPYVPRLLSEVGCNVPCVVCPPGVEHSEAIAWQRPPQGPLRLLSVGALTANKGLVDAIRAVAAVADRTMEWTIIGSVERAPEHVAELRALVRSLDLQDQVHFHGEAPPERVGTLLAEHHLLLHSSYTENFPLAPYEALARGLPVLGYDCGGLSDIVSPDVGVLVPVLDWQRLSRELTRLLGDPSRLKAMSVRARVVATAFPDWRDAAQHFVEEVGKAMSLP